MTHWKQNFNYNYTGAYELQPGEERLLTILRTAHEEVPDQSGKKQDCFVAYFKESSKPMILNKTNCKTIAKIYSPFVENWVGKQIIVKAETVKAFGEMVDALRVKSVKPEQKTADYSKQIESLKACTTLEQLQKIYLALNDAERKATVSVKDEMKTKLTPATNENK